MVFDLGILDSNPDVIQSLELQTQVCFGVFSIVNRK